MGMWSCVSSSGRVDWQDIHQDLGLSESECRISYESKVNGWPHVSTDLTMQFTNTFVLLFVALCAPAQSFLPSPQQVDGIHLAETRLLKSVAHTFCL